MREKGRINGPENSFLPEFKKLVSKRDRQAHEIRPLFCSLNPSEANGNAYIETGNSKVICSVFLKTSAATAVSCDFKFAPFSSRMRRSFTQVFIFYQDRTEKEYSMVLQEAITPAIKMDAIAKSQIYITAYVLENDGAAACLAAAISCAGLALVNAGIEMYDILSACSCCFVDSTIYVDPTADEQNEALGSIVISCMPSLNQITHVLQEGNALPDLVVEAVDLCVDACNQINIVLQSAMAEHWKTLEDTR